MKVLLMLAVSVGVTGATTAIAKQSSKAPPVLAQALDATVQTKSAANADKEAGHPGKGNEHASQRAIDVVCSKDTPAARRAAICEPPPVSPE